METTEQMRTHMKGWRMDPFAVDVNEAARLIGIKKSKVWQLVGTGEIPSFKIGRSRRVPVAAIRKWIADQSGIDAALLEREEFTAA